MDRGRRRGGSVRVTSPEGGAPRPRPRRRVGTAGHGDGEGHGEGHGHGPGPTVTCTWACVTLHRGHRRPPGAEPAEFPGESLSEAGGSAPAVPPW